MLGGAISYAFTNVLLYQSSHHDHVAAGAVVLALAAAVAVILYQHALHTSIVLNAIAGGGSFLTFPALVFAGVPPLAARRWGNPVTQWFVQRGWHVFSLDNRGTLGRGKAFEDAIHLAMGGVEVRDQKVGVDWLAARDDVDPGRIAVHGWSYGGYMTSWVLGRYPDVWKAAVTGASVTSQLDQYNLSDSAGGARGNNSPWTNPQVMERMRQQSPITNASKIKAPTLILSDKGDTLVKMDEKAVRLRPDGPCTPR